MQVSRGVITGTADKVYDPLAATTVDRRCELLNRFTFFFQRARLAVLRGPLSCDGFCSYEESDQDDDQRNYVLLQTVVSGESYQQCNYA